MTATLERARTSGPAVPSDRSPLLSGAVAAVWAVVLGLAVVAVPVLVVWAAAPRDGSGPGDALRAGVLGWLLAHHADIVAGAGVYSLVPLGLMVVPAVVTYRSGRWAGRVAGEGAVGSTLGVVAAFAATYAAAAALLAGVSASDQLHVSSQSALAAAGLLALVCGGLGVLRGAGLLQTMLARVPATARLVGRGALAGFAVLVGGAALVLAVSLAVHGAQVAALTRSLAAGPFGGLALALLGVLAMPGAVAWAAGFAVGPGFAVGTGTAVSPAGVTLGAVPAFPLLGALPGSGPAPAASLLALAVPLLAGVVVGGLMARRSPLGDPPTAVLALASGVFAGAALGLLAWFSGGSLGAGRMAALGPDGPRVGAAAALEVGVVAAAVAFEARRHSALLARVPAVLSRRLPAWRRPQWHLPSWRPRRPGLPDRVSRVARRLDPRRLRRGR